MKKETLVMIHVGDTEGTRSFYTFVPSGKKDVINAVENFLLKLSLKADAVKHQGRHIRRRIK